MTVCINTVLRASALLALLGVPSGVIGHHADATNERLAKIGPAADFVLLAQDGRRLSIQSLRGKIVVVGFTYTRCKDTCPLLTAKMVRVQNQLGDRFGLDVFFLTVSMDPEVDRPELLANYARTMGSNLNGWAFLTGTEAEIADVAKYYGIFRKKRDDGEVDHTLLTSVIDRSGTLRVQYIGSRFDPQDLIHDLKLIIEEENPA